VRGGAQEQPPLPTIEQLHWSLQAPDACHDACAAATNPQDAPPPPSINKVIYKRAVDADQLIVRSESEHCHFENLLRSTVDSVRKETKRAKKAKQHIEWHNTLYTKKHLLQNGFKVMDASKPTIVCVKRESADGLVVYEVQHVYVPWEAEAGADDADPDGCDAAQLRAHDALQSFANSRYEEKKVGGEVSSEARAGSSRGQNSTFDDDMDEDVFENSSEEDPENSSEEEPEEQLEEEGEEEPEKEGEGGEYQYSIDATEEGTPTFVLRKPRNPLGEYGDVTERGRKEFEGNMRVWGAHFRRASKEGEKVPGCAQTWADRYGPSGKPASHSEHYKVVIDAAQEHARAFSQLENSLCPEGGAFRLALANELDPDARFRVLPPEAECAADCAAFSLSTSSGYAVEGHDDSGVALEMVCFTYPSTNPMPSGHEWLFAVSGCIHPLPVKPSQFTTIALRGNALMHGTLPTRSDGPHLHGHRGVGSALITKKQMADVLLLQRQPGAKPAPTQKQLQERAAEVKAFGKDIIAAQKLSKELQETQEKERELTETLEGLQRQKPQGDSEEARAKRRCIESLESQAQQLLENKVDDVVRASSVGAEGLPPLSSTFAVPESPEPATFAALKCAIAEDDFGVLEAEDGSSPKLPLAAIRAYEAAGGTAGWLKRNEPLPEDCYILRAPSANDWASAHRNDLVKAFHAINAMARMRIVLSGGPQDVVSFRTEQARNLLLAFKPFMIARRHIAAHLSEATLKRFRGTELSDSKAQANWEAAQELLSAAGVVFCPNSGAPIMELGSASTEVRAAIWKVLLTISKTLKDGSAGTDLDASLNMLQTALGSADVQPDVAMSDAPAEAEVGEGGG